MGKGKKKAAAAAGGAASAGPTATAATAAPPKKAGWEGITLKKKKKPASTSASSSTGRRPLNTAAGAVSGDTAATSRTSVGNTTNSSRRGADSGSGSGAAGGSGDVPPASVARKVHALPNFKAQLRDLAATIPQNAPPQPGLALKRFATVFAHVPLKKPPATATEELALSRDSCKLLLTELGLFRPPRAYVTLGGYEIAWLRASSVNGGAGGGAAARVLPLSAFKTALVPGLAAALKPQKQSADELWSRLCLNAVLRLTEMRPKQKKQKQQQQQQSSRNDADADRAPQPTPVQRGAGRGPGAGASFAGRAKQAAAAAPAGGGKSGGGGKRGKKGKKMSIQDFQAERLRQQRAAQAQAMAQVRQRAQQQPPGQAASTGGAADSLKDIMEREARLQLHQERQAQAAARAKAATAQEQLHSKRLARRQQVWGNPGAPPPTGVLADGGANLRAVMAREAALKQARGAQQQQLQFVPQRQAAHRKPGGLYGGPVANRWGVPKGSDAAVPTLRDIQERERRARELQQRRRQLEQAGGTAPGSGSPPSSGDAGRPLGEGSDAVAGAWQFEDATPGEDEYYEDGDGGGGDMWDGETRRVAGVAEEEAVPDDKGFWDFDD